VTVTARSTRSTRDPAIFVSSASLPKGEGRAWLAVPRDAAQVTLEAVATTPGPHSQTVRQSLPDAAIWLDPFSFIDAPWDVKDEPMLVVEAAGLRVAGPKGGSDWRFLPLTAAPALGAADTPQLSLIEAPGLAMLMVTTSLQVSDAAQATARKACVAAGAAGDVRLSPAPFETDGAVQLLVRRGAELYPLGTAVASGTATQDASFSVTLTEADLAVVHQSLAGEAGLLAVHYLLRIAATGPLAQSLAGGPDPTLVVTDASTWRT
jgi:hypothetical protein